MKYLTIFLLAISPFLSSAQKGDYEIIINGERIPIDVDQEKTYKNKNGETITVVLRQKDTLLYSDQFIEFNYPKGYSINKTEIDEDVKQLALLTANGNGYMVQEYSNFNPSKLVDLMLDELTKESTNYGYERKDEEVTKKIAGDIKLEGKKSVLKYKGEENSYLVLTYGKKDSGILIAVIYTSDEEENQVDKNLIDLFMGSIRIKKIN